tara:strand:- start:957 stop:2327 length:1371 start_codon:yes stop_codon:yes gene_type:complete
MKNLYNDIRKELDEVSSSFCLAKWSQLTLYLQNGYNHSCHHPTPHKIPLKELEQNHKALHNTKYKKRQMRQMLKGQRPSECEYCWKIEDLGKEYISDRIYKSANSFSQVKKDEILEKRTQDIEPSYLEVSFSNTCNMKCAYCSPDISSSWMEEIQKYGGYKTSSKYNDINYFKDNLKIPYKQTEKNPYVEAFWKWWPELYPKLHTLRITGGEPLLSKDTWKVIDELIETPNKDLIFSINTNLMVPDKLIDKLIDKFNQLDGKVKELQLFTSGEATGAHNEYIRFGTNHKKWENNCEKVLSNVKNVLFSIMTTVNLTSVVTYIDFLKYLLTIREKYNKDVDFNKVQFMTNYLRYPEFLSIQNLDNLSKNTFKENVENFIVESKSKSWDERGYLTEEQINQLQRLIEYMNTTPNVDKINQNRKDFYLFTEEYDKRRNTNFKETFPQLNKFYKLCQTHI